MKTNVPIELTDDQRSRLADLIDGKSSKRKATRKEVIALCQQHIGGLVSQCELRGEMPTRHEWDQNPVYLIDPEDMAFLKDKPAGYVRGWNLVKRGSR